jgi:hypothetical protein
MDSANKVMAQLLFGIDGIKAQMETIEKWANETARTARQAFANAGALPSGQVASQMTAQQAMVQTILQQGEAKKAAIVAEGEAKANAIREAAATKNKTITERTALAINKGYAEIERASSLAASKVSVNEARAASALAESEAKKARATATLAESEAKRQAIRDKSVADLAVTEAKKQSILQESATKQDIMWNDLLRKQELAQDKHDLQMINQAEAAAARKAEIDARAGLTRARADAVAAESVARVAKTEAQKNTVVATGEAKITTEMSKQELNRQRIAKESAATQVKILQAQLAEERILYMQSRRAAFESKPTGMAGLMERRLSWLYAGGLVMGGLAGITETVSTIKEVEYGMTTIARVIEDTTFSFKGMRDELQSLGMQYGNTWDQVSDIATRWAQAGYDMNETLELTKSSLLALNTAELNAEEATNGMIAIMSQWGLTAEQLLPTIDKINKVAWAA